MYVRPSRERWAPSSTRISHFVSVATYPARLLFTGGPLNSRLMYVGPVDLSWLFFPCFELQNLRFQTN